MLLEWVLHPDRLFQHLRALALVPEGLPAGIELLKAFLERVDPATKHDPQQRHFLSLAMMVMSSLELSFDELELRCPDKKLHAVKEYMGRLHLEALDLPAGTISPGTQVPPLLDQAFRLHCYMLFAIGEGGSLNFGSEAKTIEDRSIAALQAVRPTSLPSRYYMGRT